MGRARCEGTLSKNRPVSDDVVRRVERANRVARDREREKREALKETAENDPIHWRQQHHAAEGVVDQTPEGADFTPLQGPAVLRGDSQVSDAHGNIGTPHRVETVPAVLQRLRHIDQTARMAGERFAFDFAQASLSGFPSRDLLQTVRSTRIDTSLPAVIAEARNRVFAALGALGGGDTPIGLTTWHVLGDGLTIKDCAQRLGLDARTVTGLLIGSCHVLAAHYGN